MSDLQGLETLEPDTAPKFAGAAINGGTEQSRPEPTFVTNAPDDIRGYKPIEELDDDTGNTKRIVGAAAVVVLVGALGAITYFSGVLSSPATPTTQIASNQIPPPAMSTPAQTVTPPAAPPAASDVTPPVQAATVPAERPVRTARIRAPRLREQTVQPMETQQAAPPPAISPAPDAVTVPQTPPAAPDATPTAAPQPSTDQPTPPPQ